MRIAPVATALLLASLGIPAPTLGTTGQVCPARATTIDLGEGTFTVPAGTVTAFTTPTTIRAATVLVHGVLETRESDAAGNGHDLCIETTALLVGQEGKVCTSDGLAGPPAVEPDSLVEGGDGGRGGDLRLALRALTLAPAIPSLTILPGGTICTGSGGDGGLAIALPSCDGPVAPGEAVARGGTGADGGRLQFDAVQPTTWQVPAGALSLGPGGRGGSAAVPVEATTAATAIGGAGGRSLLSFNGDPADMDPPSADLADFMSMAMPWIASSRGGDGGDAEAMHATVCVAASHECLEGDPLPEQPTACIVDQVYGFCYGSQADCGRFVGDEGYAASKTVEGRPPEDGAVHGDPAATDPGFTYGCAIEVSGSYRGGVEGGVGCSAAIDCSTGGSPATAGGTGYPGFGGGLGHAQAGNGSFGLLLGGRGGTAEATGGSGGVGGGGGDGGPGAAEPACGQYFDSGDGGRGGAGGPGGVGQAYGGDGGPSYVIPGTGGNAIARGGPGGFGGQGGNGGGTEHRVCTSTPGSATPSGAYIPEAPSCTTYVHKGRWGCGGPGGSGGAGIAIRGLGGRNSWLPFVVQGLDGQAQATPGQDNFDAKAKHGTAYRENPACP